MADALSFYDNVAGLERYLNLPPGSLRNIPIYARKGAVDAISKVKEMENTSLFRPGLFYIVLADLCANTAFNANYGDAECDLRTQWFHTSAIQAIGEIAMRNFVAFIKTIGDASLLIFSSFQDVWEWSDRLTQTLDAMSQQYPESLEIRGVQYDPATLEERTAAFRLRARRLVHLGEVSFKEHTDPLALAVSQTFKIEKNFPETDLGCTQAVADTIGPKLAEIGARLERNREVDIAGFAVPVMTYYVRKSAVGAARGK